MVSTTTMKPIKSLDHLLSIIYTSSIYKNTDKGYNKIRYDQVMSKKLNEIVEMLPSLFYQ